MHLWQLTKLHLSSDVVQSLFVALNASTNDFTIALWPFYSFSFHPHHPLPHHSHPTPTHSTSIPIPKFDNFFSETPDMFKLPQISFSLISLHFQTRFSLKLNFFFMWVAPALILRRGWGVGGVGSGVFWEMTWSTSPQLHFSSFWLYLNLGLLIVQFWKYSLQECLNLITKVGLQKWGINLYFLGLG